MSSYPKFTLHLFGEYLKFGEIKIGMTKISDEWVEMTQTGPRRGIESVVGEILLREGARRTSRLDEEETLQGQKEGDEVCFIN